MTDSPDTSASASPIAASSPVFSRHSSLPASITSTPPDSRSPTLDRPHSALPAITPIVEPLPALDAAFTKLLSGLRTRPGNEYCKRILACTEAAHADLQRRSAPALSSPGLSPANGSLHSVDILDFAGVPYNAPPQLDQPISPSHQSIASSPAGANPLSPRGGAGGKGFLSPLGSPGSSSTSHVTDLCVHHVSKKGSADGFTLVERTVSGQHRANVNKGNNSTKVYIGYKRSGALRPPPATSPPIRSPASSSAVEEKPITSVSVFFRDTPEEAPYGFTAIERTTAGTDASLHPSPSSSSLIRQPYLAFTRGDGAPLTDISLISRQYGEKLPAGWHEVKTTQVGTKADLNAVPAEGQNLYLCYRVDVQPIVEKWRALDRGDVDGDGEERLYPAYLRLLCALSVLLYSFDQKIALYTFDVFKKLSAAHVPVPLLNLFLECVCDACPLFLTYFTSTTRSSTTQSAHSTVLRFILHLFKGHLPVLTLDSVMKSVEVCLLLRHEDKANEISEAMTTRVLESVAESVRECPCAARVLGARDAEDGKDSGGNTPAAPLSPSSTNVSPLLPTRGITSSAYSLCYRCADKQYHALLTPTDYCRDLVISLTRNVQQQHELNHDVRTYRRHHLITAAFRADIAHICTRLIDFDLPTAAKQRIVQQRIGGTGPLSAGALGSGGSTGGAGARGQFSFSSVRHGEAVNDIKEETEEGVQDEDDEKAEGGEPLNLTITMTPSKLPSQNDQTIIHSEPPTPDRGGPSPDINGGEGLLFPPRRRIHSDEDGREMSTSSFASQDSQSEFMFPSFHEEEPHTPTPQRSAQGDEPGQLSGNDDIDDDEAAEAFDRGDAGVAQQRAPLMVEEPNRPQSPPLETLETLSTTPTFDAIATPTPLVPFASFSYAPDAATVEEREQHQVSRKAEKALFVLCLMWAKAATEPAPFGLIDSETLRRKQHALRLLLNVFHHSRLYFRQFASSSLLLRRLVFPSLMSASVTDNMAIFRLILQVIALLHERYQSEAMIELGAFVDYICLPYLDNPHCAAAQKTAILEVLQLSLLKSASSVVHLYYNYDNSARSWNIFERMVETLMRLIVPDDHPHTRPGHGAATGAKASGELNDADDNGDAPEGGPHRQALKLLVHLLHMQAQWIGVPGLNRPADAPQPALLPPPAPEVRNALGLPTHAVLGRRPSWSHRFEAQKNSAKTLQHAIRLAQTDKLKSALQFLRLSNPSASQPMEMAKFLYRNDSLDKREIGDLLSGTTDKFMKHEEYTALREAYISLLDFTGLSLDAALRTFLCDSGFRLPGEAQKIDRLLSSFAQQYVKDNPNVVKNFDAAYTLTFSLVLLNTDAHDPRLKGKSSSGSVHSAPPHTTAAQRLR